MSLDPKAAFWEEQIDPKEKRSEALLTVRRGVFQASLFLPKFKNLLVRESDKQYADSRQSSEHNILRIIVRDDKVVDISVRHLSNIIVDINELYEVIIRVYGYDHDDLRVGSIDSGSDKSFDFIGVADAITKLSGFIMECWDRVRFSANEKAERSIRTASEGLSVLSAIEDQIEKKSISREQGEKMKRLILNNIDNLFNNGVYTKEMEEAISIRPSEITFERNKLITYRPVPGRPPDYMDFDSIYDPSTPSNEASEPTKPTEKTPRKTPSRTRSLSRTAKSNRKRTKSK